MQRAGQLLQQLIRQSWHDYKYGMIGQINDCTKSLDKSLFLGIDSFHSNNWIESWLSSAIFDFFQILFEFWLDSKLLKTIQNETVPESSKVTAVGRFDSSSGSSGFEKAAGTVPVIKWPITRGF